MRLAGDWSALWRRKWRTALTSGGMACGVFTLLLLAALAEHFQLLATHFSAAFNHRVYICEKLSFWAGGGLLDQEKVAEVTAVRGVKSAIPAIIGRLQTDRMLLLGLPEVLIGVPAEQAQELWQGTSLAMGRWLSREDHGTTNTMLGSDVAFGLRAQVGKAVHVLDRDFTVVGILAHTGALEDRQMLVPLEVGQAALLRPGLITSIIVDPENDAESLATTLSQHLHHVEVVSPSRMAVEVERSLRVWRALIVGLGIIAAASGALCIVVTMMVSVYERTWEIGLKKAVGASNGQLLQDFLWEAGSLALLGWLAGALLASGFVAIWNGWFRQEGMLLFAMTPRVICMSLLVTVLFGSAAGTLPALAAARSNPVTALRHRP